MRDCEEIARLLRENGVRDAWSEDGWVYVELDGGRTMVIAAEDGASLSVSFGRWRRDVGSGLGQRAT